MDAKELPAKATKNWVDADSFGEQKRRKMVIVAKYVRLCLASRAQKPCACAKERDDDESDEDAPPVERSLA